MSTQKYQDAYKYMNDAQKDTMYELFESGVNREDGHVWVKYTDVENAVADIIIAQTYSLGDPRDISEMSNFELMEEARARAWRIHIPGITSWTLLSETIYRELKAKRDKDNTIKNEEA